MSKKFKRILSIFMVAFMLLGTMLVSPAFAESTITSTYRTVDISGSYNGKAYIGVDEFNKEVAIENVNDFWFTGGTSFYNNYALSKDDVEALKADNGLAYNKDNIPFNWNTSGAVTIAGRDYTYHPNTDYSGAKTVDVPSGYYSKAYFLAHMLVKEEATTNELWVRRYYEDGWDGVNIEVPVNGADKTADNADFTIDNYCHWIEGKNEKVTFTEHNSDASYVHTYSVNVNPEKKLVALVFLHAYDGVNPTYTAYNAFIEHKKILAVTLEGDMLNELLADLPETADSVTLANAYSVQAKVAAINEILNENRLTVNDFSETDAAKFNAVSAKADEIITEIESATSYTTVDLEPNSLAYTDAANYTNIPIVNDEDYFRNAVANGTANMDYTYALDGDTVEALYVKDEIYYHNGVPYHWETDGAVGISGNGASGINASCHEYHSNHIQSATVDVPDGNYTKLNFLGFTTFSTKTQTTDGKSPFYIELIYEDGTESTNMTLNSTSDLSNDTTIDQVVIKRWNTWAAADLENKKQTWLGSSAMSGGYNNARVGVYSLDVDITKTLKEVRFYNKGTVQECWQAQMKVLALTMELNKAEKLNQAINAIPDVATVSYKTIASAKAAIANLDAVLEETNKTYADLTEEEQEKITDVKAKIAEAETEILLRDQYTTVDLSDSFNSKLYLNSTNCTDVTIEKDDDFCSTSVTSGSIRDFALDGDKIDALKTDGLVYDYNDVPYDWNTTGGAISISGNQSTATSFTNSKTIDVPDGNYNNLHFLAFSVVGSVNYGSFTVELQYADTSVDTHKVSLNGWNDNKNGELPVYRYVDTRILTNVVNNAVGSTPSFMTSGWEIDAYPYTVEVNSSKTLSKVRFYNDTTKGDYANWLEQAKILALTLSNDSINTDIDALPDTTLITADNAVEVKKAIWDIKAMMEEKGVTEANLTEERQTKLTSANEACMTIFAAQNSEIIANDFNIAVKNNDNGKLNVTASAELINYIDEAKETTVVLGVYDGSKLVQNAGIKTVDAKADGITALSESFEVSNFDDLTNGKIKVMLLGSLSSLKPLAPAKDYQRTAGIIGTTNSNIKYTGRWEGTEEGMRSHWSGAYAETIFTGKNISVVLGEKTTSFYAEIDGTQTKYTSVSGTVNLTETPLSDGEHTLKIYGQEIYKNIEILGFIIDEGAELKLPSDDKLIIEFIGDSITAGQCDGYTDVTTSYSWKTFSGNTDVDRVIVAQPGITLVNDSTYYFDKGMAELYFRLDGAKTAYETVAYDVSKYSPDIIVINIGTNDGNRIIGVPETTITKSEITSTMKTFLENVRAAHKDAEIFVLRPFHGTSATEISPVVTELSAADTKLHYVDTSSWLDETYYTSSSDYTDFYDNLHPTVEAHGKIATALEAVLSGYITK